MELSVVVIHKKVGDLLSPLGWFAHLRNQFGRAFLSENLAARQAYVGTEPICVVQRRGGELVLTDFVTHKSAFLRHETSEFAENQLKEWLQSYQTDDAKGLTWVGCSGEVTTVADNFYYQLYRYNFDFDQSAGVLTMTEYVWEGEKSNILALWADFMPSVAWSLAAFSAKDAWRATVADATYQAQVQHLQAACAQNQAYTMSATRGWALQYEGDILQFYRAMRQANKNINECFFMDAGYFQWFGHNAQEPTDGEPTRLRQLLEEANANDSLLPSSLLTSPAAGQIGVPVLAALAGLKKLKVPISALSFGFINNGAPLMQTPIYRLFMTQQGNVLQAYTQVRVDMQSQLRGLYADMNQQTLDIQNISAAAEYF
jgi:hypothetical protein